VIGGSGDKFLIVVAIVSLSAGAAGLADLVARRMAERRKRAIASGPLRIARLCTTKLPCRVCGNPIEDGDFVAWREGEDYAHVTCVRRPIPPNQPPEKVDGLPAPDRP
jgi:hypothetical protein